MAITPLSLSKTGERFFSDTIIIANFVEKTAAFPAKAVVKYGNYFGFFHFW
jgi:hypothetical protein